MENALYRQASCESGSHKTFSISHLDYLPQRNLSPAPSVWQPSPKTATLVSSPASPSDEATGERIRKASLPARPPPLLLSLGREARQCDSSETAVPISPPASLSSRVTDERIRKASLPTRPPPLRLNPGRAVRKVRISDSVSVSKSRTISPMDGDNRGSFLPNPWDSDAKPQPAAFELAIFQPPSFTVSVCPANAFKAGLPRTPRETRTFISPKVISLEITQDVVDRSGVKPRQRPMPI
ncbi:hypothetical protein DFH94DRAFT_743486 [Russula ochroleuca]|uniref:Uncharacterized protein n=1 Tax=Russula ochroleuca TaxID=152965 RepID=A0A9P5T9V4_9AGAM|nr:hypothetical protein DFH94DRAFT_743486 [Russula ochroleuca]